MSTFWTPGGERPVNPETEPVAPKAAAGSQSQREPTGFGSATEPTSSQGPQEPTPEQIEALRAQLLSAPAEIVVANHAFGLFELAALHLSASPPNLDQAQLAIDGLGAVVENLSGRLGEAEPQLLEGLNSLRMAFVQIRTSAESADKN